MVCPYITHSPTIDGVISPGEWEGATERTDFVDLLDTLKPTPEIHFFTAHDKKNLYFGFIVYDDDIRYSRYLRASDDKVLFVLDTYNNGEGGYYFYANPIGYRRMNYVNAKVYWGSGLLGYFTELINFRWWARGKVYKDKYELEISIPFSELKFPNTPTQHWRIDVHVPDHDASCPFPHHFKTSYAWQPHPPWCALPWLALGHFYINEDIRVKDEISFLPYVTTGGQVEKSAPDYLLRVGAYLKYAGREAKDISLTINPDFSEIGVDVPQIEINNPFAIYYPERRQFFLEAKSLFETSLRFIYTRMINNPTFGIKFVSSSKLNEFGYIGAINNRSMWIISSAYRSEKVHSDKKSIINIVRVKRRLERGGIGLLFSARNLEGGYNYILASDNNYRLFPKTRLNLECGLSFTRDINDTLLYKGFKGQEYKGIAINLGITQELWKLNLRADYTRISPNFHADNGFITQSNYSDWTLNITSRLYKPTNYVREIVPRVSLFTKRSLDGSLLKGGFSFFTTTNFEKFVGLVLGYENKKQNYYGFVFDNVWLAQMYSSLNLIKNAVLSSGIYIGREINYLSYPYSLGYLFRYHLSSNFDLFSRGKIRLSSSYYLLSKKLLKEEIFHSQVYDLRLDYSFTNNLGARIIFSKREDAGLYSSFLLILQSVGFYKLYVGAEFSKTTKKLYLKYEKYIKFNI